MSTIRAKILVGSLITALALGAVFDANAKRLGSSRSTGKQSSSVTQRQQTPPQQQQPMQQPAQQPAQAAPAAGAAAGAAAAAAAKPKRNWGGILGGIAAGLGIGWLLSHFGLGGAALSFLSNLILIALVVFIGMWLFRKLRGGNRQQPAYAGMGNAPAERQNEPMLRQPEVTMPAPSSTSSTSSPSVAGSAIPAAAAGAAGAAVAHQPWGVPADFDTEAFLRNAKVHFVRLQAAWDAGNLDDIREFTTPEMFAEIKMDLTERGTETNKTDVVTLEAQLLGIEQTDGGHLASVRYSGMIREKAGDAAQPFAEVWNLLKPTNGGGWLLAGIQQES